MAAINDNNISLKMTTSQYEQCRRKHKSCIIQFTNYNTLFDHNQHKHFAVFGYL